MEQLKSLIQEIHRRSLWQVLAIYAGTSWVVFEIVETLTDGLGLPDWVPPLAFVLLLIGLPIVLATAILQKGGPALRSRDATLLPELESPGNPAAAQRGPGSRLRRLFTWRNAIAGGLLAFSLGGLVVASYMAMRTLGIGPVGTLVAKGVLEPRDPIVLADFEDHAGDSTLALAATEALRVDLSQSATVRVAGQSLIRRVLRRMERDPNTPVDSELAREIAIREGLKAVIRGEVYRAGAGYVVSNQVISAESGDALVAHRETAKGPSEVIPAIDRLSARLRERIGESLKSVRASKPLPRVTTSSLEALRSYARAIRAHRGGEDERAVALFEDAVRIDSTFGKAYHNLAITLYNLRKYRTDRAKLTKAWENALQYQDRQTEAQRLRLIADHASLVTGDLVTEVAAWRELLAIRPDCRSCLMNLAGAHFHLRDFPEAERLTRSALEADSTYIPLYWNTMLYQVAQTKIAAAESTLAALARRFPNHYLVDEVGAHLAILRQDYETAEARARRILETRTHPYLQEEARTILAGLAQLQGRLAAAERHWRETMALADRQESADEYVRNAVRLAEVDLWYRNDPERALRTVDAALERFPLDSMLPLNRPCLPPSSAGFRGELCGVWALAGETERARTLFEEFESSDDPVLHGADEPLLHGTRGLIALAEGRARGAIRALRAYDEGQPCTICGLAYLGWAYEEAAQPDSALAIYERYLTLQWIDRLRFDRTVLPFVYERLAALHEDAGHTSEAIRYHRKLIDLWQNADPELHPRREAARRAIVRLTSEQTATEPAGR